MTVDALRNDSGNALYALKRRARSTGGARLFGIEAIGLAISLAIWIWLPERLPLTLPFLAMSAFGLWGATDRALVTGWRRLPVSIRYLLRGLRWLVAAAGVVAAATALYLIFGMLLGTVVS